MTEPELLREYYDEEMRNVMIYSADWRMITPRRGYEAEFAKARERAECIAGLIRRLEQEENSTPSCAAQHGA